MTRRETALMSVGIAAGFIAAALTFVVPYRKPLPGSINQPTNSTAIPFVGNAESTKISVQLTPREQTTLGLETTEVRRGSFLTEIVALGRVEELEAALHTVTAKVGGRINRLPVEIGQRVDKGDAIAVIEIPNQAASTAPPYVTIYSEFSGIVRARNVTEGRFVGSGEVLMALVDLNSVAVKADIFVSDIGQVRRGMNAQAISDVLSGMKLHGTVSSIDSRSDPLTGTTPVRIRVKNPGMRLRPGMIVRSLIEVPLGSNVLTVPRTAVIDTGMEKIVYVATKEGIFHRRSIQVGAPGKNNYPVLEGVVEGETVVTRGAFLIDSQTRITGGSAELFSGAESFAEPSERPEALAYKVLFRTQPDPPVGGTENNVGVSVMDSKGNAVKDAQVRVLLTMPPMPSMGMPAMQNKADLQWTGSEYAGSISVGMAGRWDVVVEVLRGNQLLTTYRTGIISR